MKVKKKDGAEAGEDGKGKPVKKTHICGMVHLPEGKKETKRSLGVLSKMIL